MKRQELADVLDRIADRLDVIEANQAITNATVKDVAQVSALVHDMVRELHSRFIELADEHGAEIRKLKKAAGLNGGR